MSPKVSTLLPILSGNPDALVSCNHSIGLDNHLGSAGRHVECSPGRSDSPGYIYLGYRLGIGGDTHLVNGFNGDVFAFELCSVADNRLCIRINRHGTECNCAGYDKSSR